VINYKALLRYSIISNHCITRRISRGK